ncbi:MAG: hypothetical protein ACO3NR_10190, partial [Rhodothermales bacterium]
MEVIPPIQNRLFVDGIDALVGARQSDGSKSQSGKRPLIRLKEKMNGRKAGRIIPFPSTFVNANKFRMQSLTRIHFNIGSFPSKTH